jgi:GT2 family glycosyltransferase
VIRLDASGGPYAARNVAAAASDADVLLFVDGRSRCRPGLLESHRRLQSAQDVALSCSPITVEAGSTLASRAASLQDLFALTAFVGVPGRLDYYPTANLGVRRSAYLEVGGFREIRSGGDADLCWRIELAGLGRLASEDRTYMTWIPRKRIRGLLEQWYRYGQSAAYLEIMYPENGVPTEDHSRPLKAALRIAKSVAEAPKLAPVALVSGITHAVFRLSYVQARHSLRRSPRVTAMGEFSAARR